MGPNKTRFAPWFVAVDVHSYCDKVVEFREELSSSASARLSSGCLLLISVALDRLYTALADDCFWPLWLYIQELDHCVSGCHT